MNQKAKNPLTHIVSSFISTVLKDTEQLHLQGLLASSQEQPVVWKASTAWHIADATLQMGPDGSIAMSLTVQPMQSSTKESTQPKSKPQWTSHKMWKGE